MSAERFEATYEIESPVGLERAAAVVAGEQSTGTFVRLPSETDELRDRAAAKVEHIEVTGTSRTPALPCRLTGDTYERGIVRLSWPVTNIGPSLPNLMATIAGNLFELAEISAIRLIGLDVPESFAAALPGPAHGIDGTRQLMGVPEGPMIGTIIKPSIGLTVEDTAALVDTLAEAGVDFIKDDELQSSGPGNTLEERAKAVMDVLNRHADATGRKVMYAFNITGEIDEMAQRADLLERLGATCAMVSLNWVGLSGIRFLRERSSLPLHGHRNGWGLMSRSPDIGISYPVQQKIWRMAGVDHLHVNGLRNKFTEPDELVMEAAKAVQEKLPGTARSALPVFSSGQTVWQTGECAAFLGNQDFLFCAGGGIMSHPDGPGAGVTSLRQAADAARAGIPVETYAKDHPLLSAALAAFDKGQH
ncbi:ribulose-bisphosphate carboxylase large subunit family protein [Antarctobacter sp.]|uniref:ribulose-bisphosphate carboxylase large subunit family protein n=1 Tax=Antarctobacter sp. TaxID=1872577 RepID=UPI002B27AA59|nr:ribulose-bisphosphate carboxylase large subunit family protein [Antarctobacter sp.]